MNASGWARRDFHDRNCPLAGTHTMPLDIESNRLSPNVGGERRRQNYPSQPPAISRCSSFLLRHADSRSFGGFRMECFVMLDLQLSAWHRPECHRRIRPIFTVCRVKSLKLFTEYFMLLNMPILSLKYFSFIYSSMRKGPEPAFRIKISLEERLRLFYC